MFAYDNGRVNVLAENRCANTSMYRYFDIPIYSLHVRHANGGKVSRGLRDIWKTNPSQKVIVLRDPYQRIRSAISYHENYGKMFYENYKKLSIEEQKKQSPTFFLYFNNAVKSSYENFRKEDIRGHCTPYMKHLIGFEFKIINFDRISEYLDIKDGPVTDTKDKSFSNEFLEFHGLDEIELEKKLYDNFLSTQEEMTPEDWKSLTK